MNLNDIIIIIFLVILWYFMTKKIKKEINVIDLI